MTVNGQLNVCWVEGEAAWFEPMRIGPVGIANPGTFVAASQQFGLTQTDVFFVDKTGQLNVFYSDAEGSWSGPVKIGPAGFAAPGAYLAVSQQIGLNQTDVFLVDKTGQLNVFWVDGAGAWAGPEKIGAAGFAAPGGYLAASQQFGLTQTDVFLVDKTGQLNVFWVDGGGAWNGPEKIGPAGYATAGAYVAASQQFGANTKGQTDVFLFNKSGQLAVFYVVGAGAWSGAATIGPANIGKPGGYLVATQQFGSPQTDVIFNDVNGLHDVYWVWEAGAWQGPQLHSDPAAAPTGLGSNYNYLLEAGGTPLTGLTVEIDVLEAITGSDGFGFQVNTYSAAKDTDAAQQYLLTLDPSSSPATIYCMVDNWYANGTQVINSGLVKVCTLPSHTLPAGYKLTIALNNDSNHNVTGATYTVYDNTGKVIGTQTQMLTSLTDENGKQVTSAELAPIVAFQMDFVDWLNGNNTVLSSGAGAFVYTAAQAMSATAYPPSYVDWSYITLETANSLYGYMPSAASTTLQQGFQTNKSGAEVAGSAQPDVSQRKVVRHVTKPTTHAAKVSEPA